MNKRSIYKALEDPEFLGTLPVEELEKMSVAYPWFSAAQVMLARAYQQSNDHRFADQLQQAALYASDRKVLYDYLRKPSAESTIETSSVEARDTSQLDAIKEKEEDISLRNTEQEIEIIEGESEVEVTTQEDVFFDVFSPLNRHDERKSTEDKNEPSIFARSIEDSDIKPILHLQDLEEDDMVKTVLEHQKVKEDKLTWQQESIEIESNEESVEEPKRFVIDVKGMNALDREILIEAVSSSIEQEVSNDENEELQASSTSELALDQDNQEPSLDSEDAYARWMMRRSREVSYNPRLQNLNLEKSEEDSSNSESFEKKGESAAIEKKSGKISETPETDNFGRIRPRLTPTKNTHQQDLIDRFIRLEPKITPGKAAEFDTINMAKESLEEDLDFVTETMAKLLAHQGKIEKAKKAYKKLIEQHPEKSVYFAAQLKNLNTFKKG